MSGIKKNLVDYLSKNLNTNYSLLLKFKEHLKSAIYLPKNQLNTKLLKKFNTTVQLSK